MAIWERTTHFIGYLKEEALFYLCIYFVQIYAGCWLEFHFMVHALLGELVVVLPNSSHTVTVCDFFKNINNIGIML